jgi:cold shock CspA family protein
MTGLCRFWHARGHFGRIVGDDDVTYWIEKSALLGRHKLGVGDSVRFTPVAHAKGPRAHAVRVVEVRAARVRPVESAPASAERA